MFNLSVSPVELVLRTALIYFAFILALRVFGKREVGQFTIFDLALILLAANALQPAMTGPDQSVLGAFIIIGTIFAVNWAVSLLMVRSSLVRRIFEFEPTVLARDGQWQPRVISGELLDIDILEAALREHGVETVAETKLVVLEPDGEISVVTKGGSYRRKHRYRRSRL
jgi:uncharacterized membrane protein YcaP (DUF421 family)